MPIQSYRALDAWKLAMELAVSVYQLTRSFPREETFGLSSQLRRAAASIPSNVSEGHQLGTKSYAYHVSVALGSLAETETQLELANRLRYVPAAELDVISSLATDLRRTLHGLRRSLLIRQSHPDP